MTKKTRSSPSRAAGLILGAAGILAFLLLWEVAPLLGLVNRRFFPPVHEVFGQLGIYVTEPAFWGNVLETMVSWALGLAIASVLALVIGIVIGSSGLLRRATHTTVEFLRPIPSVALIPLAVLLFGTKIQSSLLLITYAAFWQILLQVLYGITDVDPVARDTARSYGLRRFAIVRYVVWPTTLPYFMTGMRLGAAVSLILAITSELIIGTPGLGAEIALNQAGGAVAAVYALVLVTGLIGVLINIAARLIERRVLSWHTSVRGEVLA